MAVIRLALVAVLLLVAGCRDTAELIPPGLPLVVQSFDGDDVVQVTVDPEGTVFVGRGGTTSRTEVPRADVRELARLVDAARLDELGSSPGRPGELTYGVLAGDTEVSRPASDVPPRLQRVLDWVLARTSLARPG